ncbi:MAG: hypothetical protein MPW15_20790 [Candidatus Manganitrophus sp.]|nr:hypothetical protein [Candidatus Manganitrophus sp.]
MEAGVEAERAAFKALLGKAGISNAKMIYQKFKEIFKGPDFLEIQNQGVSLQRVLWGSTGTKNPHYSDLLYVEGLIGPETINTVPPATLAAFKDHGKVRPSLRKTSAKRARRSRNYRDRIHLQQVTHQLQEEGVKSFSESFEKLTARLTEKRRNMLAKKIA